MEANVSLSAITNEETDIPCGGDRRLHCKIVRPSGASWARLLIVHGYGEHAGRYLRFMQFMAGAGVAVEAIDLRGHGRSSGRRGFISRWEEYFEDLAALLERAKPGETRAPPAFLMGHSHGGLIVAAAAERGILTPYALGGAILSSPYLATLQHVPAYKIALAHLANRLIPWLPVANGLRPEWITGDDAMRREDRDDPLINRHATPRWFLSMRVAQAQALREAAAFELPLLCLIGDKDRITDPVRVANFYANAGSFDKSLYTYRGGVHELLRDFTREKASTDVLAWIRARVAWR